MIKIPAFIFARGGSKGLKDKNIKKFNGKPLIYWTIKELKKSKFIDSIYLSTDSKKIRNIANKYKIQTPFLRPKNLSKDTSAEIFAWKHFINFLKKENKMPSIFFSCPVTSPLREVSDINNMINLFFKKKADTVVGITESHRNPYFNMMKENNRKKLSVVLKSQKKIYNRQNCPVIYDLTTFGFIVKTKNILKNKDILKGNVYGYKVPKKKAIDIDDEQDFKFAEFIMKRNDKS